MILTVDIGNTNINLGVFDDKKIVCTARLSTERRKTTDQYAVEILNILMLHKIYKNSFSGAIICSVVPELNKALSKAVFEVTEISPVMITSDLNTGLKIINNKSDFLGADLAAVSIGAIQKYELPCIIVDLGTATKIILLDENGMFMGCSIAPGVKTSLDALANSASLLPTVELKAPTTSIGTNTLDSMKSGTIFGTSAMIDGLIERIENEFGRKIKTVIGTGGLGEEIVKCCKRDIIYDKNLILCGMRKIYEQQTNK